MTKEITTRACAFARVEQVRCRIDDDGTIRVYDPIARHYTRCHSLSQSAQRRIRRAAQN